LADDFRSKIDFVKWRADAGGDLGDEIGWAASGCGAESFRGSRGDAEFGAFFPGMHEGDAPGETVGKKNGRAVGDIDAETDSRNGCQKPVGSRDGKMRVGGDFGHMVAMNLLRGGEGHAIQADVGTRLHVGRFQPCKGLLPLDVNIKTGNPAGEDSADSGNRVNGGEGLGDHIVTSTSD